jgi:hypothetical protein
VRRYFVVDDCAASVLSLVTLLAPALSETSPSNAEQHGPSPAAQQAAPPPASVVAAVPIPPDSRIGEVSIEIVDVFDRRVPAERGWAPGAANAIHVSTRASVVRRELLFGPGDPYDAERLLQTERNLRALGIFRKVEVVVLPPRAGLVRVRVRVQDAWTLGFGGSFSHQGGVSTYDVRLRDANLAGLGVGAGVRRAVGFERSEYGASLVQNRLFGTRERLAFGVATPGQDRRQGPKACLCYPARRIQPGGHRGHCQHAHRQVPAGRWVAE